MVAAEGVDSRHYRFGFVADLLEELPADFGLREIRSGFASALFLPRDDAGWFSRSLYPARVIFLYEDALEIRGHPASGEAATQIPIHELEILERGHLLLHGWLRFVGAHSERHLLYNTRSTPAVSRFLESVQRALFVPRPQHGGQASFGPSLDLKFSNARADALLPGENVLVQFFHPAQRRLRGLGLWKRESWSSADLLAITDRRVVWITNRLHERHEFYGTISTSAPLGAVTKWALSPNATGLTLTATLKSGAIWRSPVPHDLEAEARGFVEAIEAL